MYFNRVQGHQKEMFKHVLKSSCKVKHFCILPCILNSLSYECDGELGCIYFVQTNICQAPLGGGIKNRKL